MVLWLLPTPGAWSNAWSPFWLLPPRLVVLLGVLLPLLLPPGGAAFVAAPAVFSVAANERVADTRVDDAAVPAKRLGVSPPGSFPPPPPLLAVSGGE
jgi:hypothetical protein